MKLFLSHAGLGEVKGGVELYAQYLEQVFPDVKKLDYHSLKNELGDVSFPFFREPKRAELLGKYAEKNFPDADIFSNGMFCWNLKTKNQINICHGTYAAFAESAVPKTNPDFYRLRFIYNMYEKIAAKKAKAVVANSESTASNIKRFFGIDAEIIHPPVDTSLFFPLAKENSKEKLGWKGVNVLFVGRPEYAKGFDIMQKLAIKNPEITFNCILSRSFESTLKNLVVITPQKHSDLPLFYNASDLVLFPSRFEGFGFVTIEALSCGKKIVTLNTGIAPELESPNIFICHRKKDIEKTFYSALLAEESKPKTDFKNKFSFETFRKKWISITH